MQGTFSIRTHAHSISVWDMGFPRTQLLGKEIFRISACNPKVSILNHFFSFAYSHPRLASSYAHASFFSSKQSY